MWLIQSESWEQNSRRLVHCLQPSHYEEVNRLDSWGIFARARINVWCGSDVIMKSVATSLDDHIMELSTNRSRESRFSFQFVKEVAHNGKMLMLVDYDGH